MRSSSIASASLRPTDQIVLVAVTSAHRGDGVRRLPLPHGLPQDARAVLEEGTDARRARAGSTRASATTKRPRAGSARRCAARVRNARLRPQPALPLDRLRTATVECGPDPVPGIRGTSNGRAVRRSSPSTGARRLRAPICMNARGDVDGERTRRSASRSVAGRPLRRSARHVARRLARRSARRGSPAA